MYDATKKHAVRQAGDTAHTYTYDANGNAITRNGNSITWNKYNYPTAITGSGESATLYYDANMQRWKQVYTKGATTETTIYVGGLLQKVTTGSTTDWRYIIQGGDGQTVAMYSRKSSGTNTLRYVLEDYQGSVSKITDTSGSVFVSENFTAFGDRRNPSTWSGAPTAGDLTNINTVTRDGYTGQTALGSMGLNHMNGRVQDAITGRFLSADPHITDPTNPQNYNRYSYVLNNPMSYTDPTGFDNQPQDCKEKEGDKQRGSDTQVECKEGNGDTGNSNNEDNKDEDSQEVVITACPGCEAFQHMVDMWLLDRYKSLTQCMDYRLTPAPYEEGIESICPECYLIGAGGTIKSIFQLGDFLVGKVAARGTTTLYRYKNGAETATRLARGAAEAQKKLGIHGVSVTTNPVAGRACGAACRDAVEQVFPVVKTGGDPNHFTVVLPNPVTKEVADAFNALFRTVP